MERKIESERENRWCVNQRDRSVLCRNHVWISAYVLTAAEAWFDDADGVDEDGKGGLTEDRAERLDRSDDPTMQREIGKGLIVMEERAQSHRLIIRQAANAELLAHNQTPSTSVCHVYPRKQMLSCQSCLYSAFWQAVRYLLPVVCACLCQFSVIWCCICAAVHDLVMFVQWNWLCVSDMSGTTKSVHTTTHTHTHTSCMHLAGLWRSNVMDNHLAPIALW